MVFRYNLHPSKSANHLSLSPCPFHSLHPHLPQSPQPIPSRPPDHPPNSPKKTYLFLIPHPLPQLLKLLLQPRSLCKKRRSLGRHMADMNYVTAISAVFLQDGMDYGAGGGEGGYGE